MDSKNVCNRIRTERIKLKINQKKLAEIIGVDPTVYSRMERGEREFSIDNLLAVSRALNKDIEYFLYDKQKECPGIILESLLHQINKLDNFKRKRLTDIIAVILENPEALENTSIPPPNEYEKAVNYVEIGRRIRTERLRRNLTQEKLSELADISENFLGNIERAAAIPSIESLFKIANALNQPVTRLLMNANKWNKELDLLNTKEVLKQIGDDKSAVLLNLLTILADNSEKW